MINKRLNQKQKEALNTFCKVHHIKKLAFFGSVITSRFHSSSDIDILVEFQEEHIPGYAFFSLQDELENILRKKVDLSTVGGLHPFIKDRVIKSAQTYYELP